MNGRFYHLPDVGDDEIIPTIPILWDKDRIESSIEQARYDHQPRMIFDRKGKVRGFILLDSEGMITFFADGDPKDDGDK